MGGVAVTGRFGREGDSSLGFLDVVGADGEEVASLSSFFLSFLPSLVFCFFPLSFLSFVLLPFSLLLFVLLSFLVSAEEELELEVIGVSMPDPSLFDNECFDLFFPLLRSSPSESQLLWFPVSAPSPPLPFFSLLLDLPLPPKSTYRAMIKKRTTKIASGRACRAIETLAIFH